MKRLRGRTAITMILAAALAVGILYFCIQLFTKGND